MLRGPQGFIYGADAGGVVNVLTKRGAGDFGGQLGLEYGEFSTRKIDGALSGGGDRGDYYVSVTDFQTDGFNARTADTVLLDDDGDDNTTIHAKFGWNASENLRLQFVGARHRCRDRVRRLLLSGDASRRCTIAAARPSRRPTKSRPSTRRPTFSNSFGYSDVDIVHDNFTQGQSAFATEGEISRLEYTGSYRPSAATALVYGLDFQDEGIVDCRWRRGAATKRATTSSIKVRPKTSCSCRSARATTTTTISARTRARA